MVIGDRYGGEWPRERFFQHSITYRVAEKTRSDIYCELLPELNSKSVALLDNQRLIAQLVGLERRTARGGKDMIDHAPGAHDDLANAVAGALLAAKPPAIKPFVVIEPIVITCPRGIPGSDGASTYW